MHDMAAMACVLPLPIRDRGAHHPLKTPILQKQRSRIQGRHDTSQTSTPFYLEKRWECLLQSISLPQSRESSKLWFQWALWKNSLQKWHQSLSPCKGLSKNGMYFSP